MEAIALLLVCLCGIAAGLIYFCVSVRDFMRVRKVLETSMHSVEDSHVQ